MLVVVVVVVGCILLPLFGHYHCKGIALWSVIAFPVRLLLYKDLAVVVVVEVAAVFVEIVQCWW